MELEVSNTSLFASIIGLAIVSASASAACLDAAQFNKVRVGQFEAGILASFGKSVYSPSWSNGTHSLVHRVADASKSSVRAYVNIGADHKVVNVHFDDNGQN